MKDDFCSNLLEDLAISILAGCQEWLDDVTSPNSIIEGKDDKSNSFSLANAVDFQPNVLPFTFTIEVSQPLS